MKLEMTIRNLNLEGEVVNGKLRTLKREADVSIEGYFTAKEVADLLGVTHGRVRQLIRSGEIEAVKIGGTWLISQVALEAFKLNWRRPGWPKGKPRKPPISGGEEKS